MSRHRPLGLFEGYGIELEYMIVDAQSLDVRPIADQLLCDENGQVADEVEHDGFAWSNELARHLIELKTNGPTPGLDGLAAGFAQEIGSIHALLADHGARLLPGGMHPWMDPDRDFEIWPHGYRKIYQAFDRIFDCRGHGWSNLQSMHLNLPFSDDAEFGRLHAAARALLPILPALAASTPFRSGDHPGTLDTRLDVYRHNARRVPSVAGAVIPEPLYSRRDYEAMLEGIYADLEPFDPEGLLRHEWVNSRGCIARFDRMAIEIRVLDVQECPQADIAIAAAVSQILKRLCDPSPRHQERLRSLDTKSLAAILQRSIRDADTALLDDAEYTAALGVDPRLRTTGDVWRQLLAGDVFSEPGLAEHHPALERFEAQGPLARRLLARLGPTPATSALREVYRELADCLRDGRLFDAVG